MTALPFTRNIISFSFQKVNTFSIRRVFQAMVIDKNKEKKNEKHGIKPKCKEYERQYSPHCHANGMQLTRCIQQVIQHNPSIQGKNGQ